MLSVAVIGAGYFAGFHVEGWHRNPDTELAAVIDLDEDKARSLLAEHGAAGAKAAADLNVCQGPFDIIDIAAPPTSHAPLIREALDTDARAIICQKPFCTSLDEAQAVTREAAEAGKPLIVHENFRFQPWYRTMRQMIDSGRIGDLYQITFRLRPGDGQGPDAYLSRQPYFQAMERFLVHETAVHWIDTFRFLLGEPTDVFADLRRLNPNIAGEDAGYFLYRFKDGKRALFDGNRLSDHPADNPRLTMGECLAEGSEGTLMLDGFGRLFLRQRGAREWGPVDYAFDDSRFGGDCVYHLQKHVSDHLLHGTPIENDAASYLRNIEIENAIYHSASKGCVVSLEAQ
ncbi:Gfo/Idh/MocA family protein [Nitratireductor kimnyeongensis]|uniref:Gfo/Idh/MocA family protein n=1 Tax=Nitratireductor kimnyeongensis TaxID=430679 RepID=A0ABW0T6U4_9HYPH|nr:Gfo/Idh/MocA family oxidoreductase [Nitratireductor kimnyeongensis]QZZ34042.1 Gfo/Idh/MocA family oxidoreductase [Nitratireductor kimnyeongensis]